jgi:hypothetical protein
MSVEHVENPTIPNRVSMDKTVNALGRKLLQMCYNTGLTVANGRLGNDMEERFTFCSTRGRSVNDYQYDCLYHHKQILHLYHYIQEQYFQ